MTVQVRPAAPHKHFQPFANNMIVCIMLHMSFEWDEAKNSDNISKHTLSFYEAQEAFFDINRLILEDIKHST